MNRSNSHSFSITRALEKYGLLMILIVLLVLFSVARPDSFFVVDNFRGVIEQDSVVMVLALAVMLTLLVGQFDLSVAAIAAAANVLCLGLLEKQGLPLALAIIITILAGGVVGAANGVIVRRFQVSAFVTTLGMSSVVVGLALWYSGGVDILSSPSSYTGMFRNRILGVPLSVVYVAVLCVVLYICVEKLVVGRRLQAVGGNARAAELTGINVGRYVAGSFVVGGLLAGFSGVILGGQLGIASSASDTTSVLLPAFAAAFLGSTAIKTGRFNVGGTIVAVLFLSFTVTGILQLGAAVWVEPVFEGASLIVAVALSAWAGRVSIARAQRKVIAATQQASDTPDEAVPGNDATAVAHQR